jgi:ribonuclease-3
VVDLPLILRVLPLFEDDGAPTPAGADTRPRLAVLESRLGYSFARPSLLRAALTLGSWSHEHPESGWPSNACLEFFGDAVLDLLAADAIWQRHPTLDEGALTILRASVVSEPTLADVATALDLGAFLWLGRGEDRVGGRRHRPHLADAMEAVLGAVFLDARERGDSPLDAVTEVFARVFGAVLDAATPDRALDPKTRLQHWAQARHRISPAYVRLDAREGDSGPPRWRARAELRHASGEVELLGEGEGDSIREAERRAAEAALLVVEATADGAQAGG